MPSARLRVRLHFPGGAFIGPGKAELLAHIAETGSIAGAGRAMGMSYKRAWLLVEALNTMFSAPLVASARGGSRGGRAELTGEGKAVLAAYCRLVEKAESAGSDEIAQMLSLLAKAP